MGFYTSGELLDTIVLALISQEKSYGYKITQNVRNILDISESTLYPVLRRLQKNGYLETYDEEFAGKIRRYYKITAHGMIELDSKRREWKDYRGKIDLALFGEKE